jgi:hypothetical protein
MVVLHPEVYKTVLVEQLYKHYVRYEGKFIPTAEAEKPIARIKFRNTLKKTAEYSESGDNNTCKTLKKVKSCWVRKKE